VVPPPAPVVAQAPAQEAGGPGLARGESNYPAFSSAEEPRVDGDDEESKRDKHELSPLDARASMGVLHRTLEYSETAGKNVGDYVLPAAPIVDLGIRVFPGAFFSKGWLSYLGLDLHTQFSFGLASLAPDGTRYDTQYVAYDLDLLVRYPIRRHEIHGVIGYGAQVYRMEDSEAQQSPVPDVDYRAVRFGAGGRFELAEGYGVGLDAAWLVLTALGEIESDAWFPRASGSGIEAQLCADARVYKALSARLFVGYRHQFFAFDTLSGDPKVAGGAIDQYVTAGLGLGYAY
jgi:hypothetical protein